MKVIKLKEILGTQVRSRVCIKALKDQLFGDNRYCIDLEGVTFISRSFADELYNLSYDNGNINFVNKSSDVEKMMKAVWDGRAKKRVRTDDKVTIENISTMEELSKFFQTI
jgi:hypothetical protein